MKKKLSILLFVIGIMFLINAILGRYIILPGYFESLESGTAQGSAVPSSIDVWKVVRYMIWAYSYKFGIYFIIVGAFLRTKVKRLNLALYIIGGVLYIGFAYMPIPGPSWLFGLGGAVMTVFIIILILLLVKERDSGRSNTATQIDYRLFSYFFFAMATYNLCPLLGVKCFALEPERMIRYGLEATAQSFAAHILIELVLGWLFLFLSHYPIRSKKSNT